MKKGKNALWIVLIAVALAFGVPFLMAVSGQIDIESDEGLTVAVVLFCMFILIGVISAIASVRQGKTKPKTETAPDAVESPPVPAQSPKEAPAREPGVLFGFLYPLTWQGARGFIKTFIVSAIPILGLGAPAFAYPKGEKPVKGRFFKMIWLVIRLFLPSFALFLICNEAIYRGAGLILGYALMALTALSLLSAALRLPMALAVIAAGGRMRDALKRGYVYKLIFSSFGSYLLLLIGILPFAVLIALTDALAPWLAAICSALIITWLRLYIGFGASVCREKAARGTSGKPGNTPLKGAIASALVVITLITGVSPYHNIARAEQSEGALFAEKLKQTFSFENGRIPILSTAWESISGGFSRVSEAAGSGYRTAMERLGVLADVMPFVSNVNDLA